MVPELVIQSHLNPAEAALLVDMQVRPSQSRPRESPVRADVKAGPAPARRDSHRCGLVDGPHRSVGGVARDRFGNCRARLRRGRGRCGLFCGFDAPHAVAQRGILFFQVEIALLKHGRCSIAPMLDCKPPLRQWRQPPEARISSRPPIYVIAPLGRAETYHSRGDFHVPIAQHLTGIFSLAITEYRARWARLC